MEISLRHYQLSDVDHLMAWACDPRVLEFSRLNLWLSHNSSRQEIESYFRETVIPHPWYRAICLNNQPIGFISVEPGLSSFRCQGSLSYALGRDYWGRGIATTATRMAVRAAFKELPDLLRVAALVEPENIASQILLENVGFLKEGFLRKYFLRQGVGVDVLVH